MTPLDISPQTLDETARDPTVSMTTVLLVDDEPPILDLLQDLLEDAGYRVLTAPDGRAALTIAQQNAVSLILTDLMMPHMDGQALCTRLRADPRTAQLPILLMTAARHPQIDSQFTGVISKPFNVDDILRIIRHYTT